MLDFFRPIQEWLGVPENAEKIDPIVFFWPRLIDSMAVHVFSAGITVDDLNGALDTAKYITGVLLLLLTLALARHFMRRNLQHWLPVVGLLGFWSMTTLAAPTFGQSVVICGPEDPVNQIPEAPWALKPYLSPMLRGPKS